MKRLISNVLVVLLALFLMGLFIVGGQASWAGKFTGDQISYSSGDPNDSNCPDEDDEDFEEDDEDFDFDFE